MTQAKMISLEKRAKPAFFALSIASFLLAFGIFSAAQAYSEREGKEMYQRGLYLEALEHWKKAAAAGDSGAAYQLAVEYFDAKIVERDVAKALTFLKQAAEDGDARALAELATYYDYGTGVPEDREKAAQLYLRAARLGIPAAMFNVASMLENGEGLPQDKVLAYKYYVLSSDRGFFPFASKAIAKLSTQMSPEELAKGQELADNFMPGLMAEKF